LKKDGFKISTNGNYYTAMLSTLFYVQKEIPINYNLVKDRDERRL
jgi:hypothetical protein